MARLTAHARKALPASTFAGPGRSFPIPDKNHAKAALGLIGHAPAAARPKIRARAEAMLHKGVSGHQPPEHSKLNKGGRGGKHHYRDTGTMHHAPKGAHPGEGHWPDKHEATRHNRRGANNLFR